MSLRDATEADAEAITRIYNEVIRTSDAIWLDDEVTVDDRLDWLRAALGAGHDVVVACDDQGQVVGYASLGPFRTKSGYWPTVEHSVHVDGRHRGAGIGQDLLDELTRRATSAGRKVMVAAIDGGNDGSIRFHERNGFRTVGTLPGVGRKSGRVVDLVLMQRDLEEAQP